MEKEFRCRATIRDGKIVFLHESTKPVSLKPNQIALTSNEIAILRIIDGNLELGKNILRDIEERVAKHIDNSAKKA